MGSTASTRGSREREPIAVGRRPTPDGWLLYEGAVHVDAGREWSKGYTHGRALRGVADRMLRILIAMLTTRTLYDPLKPRQAALQASPAPSELVRDSE